MSWDDMARDAGYRGDEASQVARMVEEDERRKCEEREALAPAQADLVALLHEIGGVEQQEIVRRGAGVWVKLTMVGDGARKVLAVVDSRGQVEWKIAGERL